MRTLLIFILFCSQSLLAQINSLLVPDTVFYKIYGGPNQEEAKDFIETNDKGFLICGSSSSFGQGTSSVYLIKTDSNGIFKWSKTYGGINADKGMSIVKTPDNGAYISGYSNSFNNLEYDAYCIKIDSIGTMQWQRSYEGNDWDFIYSSALMPDSGLVMVGETYSNTAGDADAYIIRINKQGDVIWTQKFGTALYDKFNAITIAQNSIYVCGQSKQNSTFKMRGLMARYNFSGTLMYSSILGAQNNYDYELTSINSTQNQQLLICGSLVKADSTLPQSDLRMRVDTNFVKVWRDSSFFTATKNGNYLFEKTNQRIINAVTLVGGSGKTALFLAEFDQNDAYVFGSTYGGLEDEEGRKCILSSRNKLVALGNTYSWGYGDKDYWLVMFKADTLIGDQKIKFYTHTDTTSLNPFNLKEFSLKTVSVFPNPLGSKESIFITNIDATKSVTIEFINVNGQVIFKNEYDNSELVKIDLTILNLTNGVYYLRFVQDNAVKVAPLLIQD